MLDKIYENSRSAFADVFLTLHDFKNLFKTFKFLTSFFLIFFSRFENIKLNEGWNEKIMRGTLKKNYKNSEIF